MEGFFFDDTKVKDKRALTIRDLDEASTAHPVVVRHRGGHTYFYNSKAFELAGVTKNTPYPMGGTFDKDSNGELNGRVTDLGSAAFSRVGIRPTFTPAQIEERTRAGLAHISKEFARFGLTSVHHQGGNLQAMQEVRARGELLHRISYETSGAALDAMIAAGIRTGFGDEWIKFGSTSEHLVDGSFSERTMALSTPYPGVTPPYKGNVTETQETLNAWVERVHRAGIQINCHANGDVAIDMYLTAAERALAARAARQRPAEDYALHADQSRSRPPHQGHRRRAGALYELRLLQSRQVRVLRRGVDAELHGVSLAASMAACLRPPDRILVPVLLLADDPHSAALFPISRRSLAFLTRHRRRLRPACVHPVIPCVRRLPLAAHQAHRRLRGPWIPALLAIDGDAVLQIGFVLIVALEMNFVRRMMRVVDQFEVRELIGSL